MSVIPTRSFRFSNFHPSSAADLRDVADVWLADVCAAAWITKEAQKLAAVFVENVVLDKNPAVYSRDLESKYNIQAEEVNRGLKLLKLFSAIEEYSLDKGRLTIAARVSLLQRVKLLELQQRHRELAPNDDQAISNAADALRAVAAVGQAGPVAQLIATDPVAAA